MEAAERECALTVSQWSTSFTPPNHPGIAEQYVTKGFREEHLMGLEGQRKQSGEMAPFS